MDLAGIEPASQVVPTCGFRYRSKPIQALSASRGIDRLAMPTGVSVLIPVRSSLRVSYTVPYAYSTRKPIPRPEINSRLLQQPTYVRRRRRSSTFQKTGFFPRSEFARDHPVSHTGRSISQGTAMPMIIGPRMSNVSMM